MANIPEIHYDPVFLKSLGMVPVSYLKYYYMQTEHTLYTLGIHR